MNILLVSQCSKRALTQTRRILDQFAERRGERTWQTAITQAGLDTLRKLLKKTARRNTAVACHWIRARDHSELLWMVGDVSRFNAQGAVPTHTTTRDILRTQDENDWRSGEDIRLLARMAALFHDVGKASAAFQSKLKSQHASADAYRHEWVSLRVFAAFVGDSDDAGWLQRLSQFDAKPEMTWLKHLQRDDRPPTLAPFKSMPALAQAVGWLIVSHHRLPCSSADINAADLAFLPAQIGKYWNAAREEASAKEKAACWTFAHGLPFDSQDWRAKSAACATAILARNGLCDRGRLLLADPYVMHVARLVLMLADHHYSSQDSQAQYGDPAYALYANTDRDGRLKQRLDEHLIGVAVHTRKLMGTLPRLESQLPRIARHKGLQRHGEQARFRWQNTAYNLTCGLRERARGQGFFGINMASTGCGKTIANGRIMYALADPQRGARFTIALGLRTLTLQTGQVYRQRMQLGDDDLAVLVGGAAVRELFDLGQQAQQCEVRGSESAQDLLPPDSYLHVDGYQEDGPLKAWLGGKPMAHKLVNAPVLVCTVDHLMPACESVRGGQQIAPMLRLLTADLVLDEPDDFDLNDLPALSRLVHWAGLLGSRVLLSSATLPPALVQSLFTAYRAGRAHYRANRGDPAQSQDICCAWFDEFDSVEGEHATPLSFAQAHGAFVDQRLKKLKQQEVRRRAEIVPLPIKSREQDGICRELAALLPSWMQSLHERHHTRQDGSGRRVSFGLLRFAHIDPLIIVAQYLAAQGAPPGLRLHLCIYHARHPLMLRSAMEAQLDQLLQRSDDSQAIFQQAMVKQALQDYPEQDHVFVVLASPVCEVGRDHDYDWAIVEPSSMRSLIQLAGRVRRHRSGACGSANLYVLASNLAALKGDRLAYCKPGFESTDFPLRSHQLQDLLLPEQWQAVDAAPRIAERPSLQPEQNLADLEHCSLRALMLAQGASSTRFTAPLWWQTPAPLCGVLQSRQRFRAGAPTIRYALTPDVDADLEQGDDNALGFHEQNKQGEWRAVGNMLEEIHLATGAGISFWGMPDYWTHLKVLVEATGLDPLACAQRFAWVQLRETKQGWAYHHLLGFKREK